MADSNDGNDLPARKPDSGQTQPGLNGGTLKRGGNNGPGWGRPSIAVRARCRRGFDALVPRLLRLAQGRLTQQVVAKNGDVITVEPAYRDQIAAADTLAKYGIGTKIEAELDATVRFEFVVRREV